jgi:hypothetical protein
MWGIPFMFKRLLTVPEEKTYGRLGEACSRNGARLFPKIRLADVLPIDNSGLSDELFAFALRSHFDFVIADDNQMPLFSVEIRRSIT